MCSRAVMAHDLLLVIPLRAVPALISASWGQELSTAARQAAQASMVCSWGVALRLGIAIWVSPLQLIRVCRCLLGPDVYSPW